MRKFIWILMLVLAIPVFAQGDDPASAAFHALEVSNVRLRLGDEDAIELIFNASPTVCEDLLLDIDVDGQFIEVNAYVPGDATVCNTLVAYEPVIALPDLETGQAFVLFLNDFTSTFYLTEVDEDSSIEPFAALWGQDNFLIGFNPVAPLIDSIDFSSNNNGMEVTLTGNHPDGCVTQEITRLYQDDIQDNLYHVSALRLVPDMVICPAELQAFEATIPLNLDEGDIVEIDGNYFIIEDDEPVPVTQYRLQINSVEVLSTANGNIAVVEGTQDCGFEIDADIIERDFMSMIALVTYVAVDEPCGDETTPYEASFDVSVLPVVINGIAYDESGEISPPASAQSDIQAPEVAIEVPLIIP